MAEQTCHAPFAAAWRELVSRGTLSTVKNGATPMVVPDFRPTAQRAAG